MEIQGIIEDIVYRNEENGYTVAKLYTEEGSITIVGIATFIRKDEPVLLEGYFTYHDKFGEQFKFEQIKSIMPSSVIGIKNYLASGLIPNIGPKTAEKIVDRFGDKALDIIQYYPERLLEIDGIGKKKLEKIMQSFDEQREAREVVVALQEFNISANQSMKIYKQYGNDTLKVIRENPYRLAEDIYGIGFRSADDIARKMGVSSDSPYRIRAALKYIILNAAGEGHCYLPEEELLEKTSMMIQVSRDLVKVELSSLLFSQSFFMTREDEKNLVYYMPYHVAENNVAKSLVELSLSEQSEISLDVDKVISDIEKESEIKFGEKQISAIKSSIQNGVCVITGGPGTGKTTIINAIIKIMEFEKKEVLLAAPTGRAAKKITETTNREAKTIHRLLEISFANEESGFNRDEDSPLDCDVIIIDELSMIDIILMSQLLKAIRMGTRLILVGDVDQLPSVGAGNVLKDIINSGVIKVLHLDEIFRQGEASMITLNAHLVNKGKNPLVNEKDKDFFFIHNKSPGEILQTITNLCSERLPKFYGFHPLKDIQVLSPMRKGDLGVVKLNEELQKVLNPKSESKRERRFGEEVFREGDKIMQVKNNYQITWEVVENNYVTEEGTGVFNGDFGYIEEIDDEEGIIKVLFEDGKRVFYEFKQADELKLAYATTIHKSQGSEFPAVIIPAWSGPPMLLTRNLFYTAITRARDLVVLVGEKRYISQMIRNNLISRRYSSLDKKITSYFRLLKEIHK